MKEKRNALASSHNYLNHSGGHRATSGVVIRRLSCGFKDRVALLSFNT